MRIDHVCRQDRRLRPDEGSADGDADVKREAGAVEHETPLARGEDAHGGVQRSEEAVEDRERGVWDGLGHGENARLPRVRRRAAPWRDRPVETPTPPKASGASSTDTVGGVSDQAATASRFLELHRPGQPLLMPNPWDVGSARLLESLGFHALATTSSGFASTLGRLDGGVTRDEAVDHAGTLAAAVGVPVSADLENAFADDPEGVAETFRRALAAGLAGASVEDYSGDASVGIYPLELASERVAAAVAVAHEGPVRLVVTARAENLIRGVDDLGDTIARLQAYAAAGADVVFAPGLKRSDAIRQVVDAVDVPVNVLVLGGSPSVAELADAGVARISVGGAFAFAAINAVVEAAQELLGPGTYGYTEAARAGVAAARSAFSGASGAEL
jgi:2-methylisocitrate lyase-like PEP mutase family enzyme